MLRVKDGLTLHKVDIKITPLQKKVCTVHSVHAVDTMSAVGSDGRKLYQSTAVCLLYVCYIH